MKVPPMGWTFLAFAGVVFAGYALIRGVYVGSIIKAESYKGDPMYSKYCRYLHLTGPDDVYANTKFTREEVTQTSCPPLRN